jgi:hypothetical protein
MTDSILDSTKKILGIDASYTHFDLDIMTHINTVFTDLYDLGVGPPAGFMIEDKEAVWGDFTSDDLLLNSIKSYMYLRCRLMFDPPGTSFAIASIEKQIASLEWRLNVRREDAEWVPPSSLSLP